MFSHPNPVLISYCFMFSHQNPLLIFYCFMFSHQNPLLISYCFMFSHQNPVLIFYCFMFSHQNPVLISFPLQVCRVLHLPNFPGFDQRNIWRRLKIVKLLLTQLSLLYQ
jgi:hypothetical protein